MSKNNNNYEVTKKYIFFGFLDKQDRLIKGWLNIELWIIVVISLSSLICIANGYAMLAWIAVYIITTIILAIVSTCRTVSFYKLSQKGKEVVLQHKNQELKEIFSKGPKYLSIIIGLDLFYPITWMFSFVLKLAFTKNASDMKMMITVPQTL